MAFVPEHSDDDLCPHESGECPPHLIECDGGAAPTKPTEKSDAHRVGHPHGSHTEPPIQSTHDNPIHLECVRKEKCAGRVRPSVSSTELSIARDCF